MKILTTIALSLLLTAGQWAPPAEAVKLRLDLPEGTNVLMSTNFKMNFFTDSKLTDKMMSQDIKVDNNYRVTAKSEDGGHSVEYMLNRIRMEQDMMGQTSSYDSENPDPADPLAATLNEQFGDLINRPFKFSVSPLGEISNIEEDGELLNSFSGADQLFIKFPEKELRVGDTWSEQQSVNTGGQEVSLELLYKVHEITRKKVMVKARVKEGSVQVSGEEAPDMELKQEGTYQFDRETGQLLSMEMSQLLEMQNPQAGEIFMLSDIDLKVVEN